MDNYLDVPFDLSRVMFVATANVVANLPAPLLDRLRSSPFRAIRNGEKCEIARRYLLPRQLQNHGLASRVVEFSEEAVTRVIRDYTREAGLRQLGPRPGHNLP